MIVHRFELSVFIAFTPQKWLPQFGQSMDSKFGRVTLLLNEIDHIH